MSEFTETVLMESEPVAPCTIKLPYALKSGQESKTKLTSPEGKLRE